MDFRLLYAIILTLMPVTELRVGLPLGIIYAKDVGLPVILISMIILLVNILLIFFVFYFLDNLHHLFMKLKFYRKFFEKILRRIQKKVDKFENRHPSMEFLMLVLFVGIPIPGTGVWSGVLISWLLGLERKRSILAMMAGVLISGTIIFLGTIGFIGLLS